MVGRSKWLLSRQVAPSRSITLLISIGVIPKNNEANVLQNGQKNHISLIHSLHAIFLSCLIKETASTARVSLLLSLANKRLYLIYM